MADIYFTIYCYVSSEFLFYLIYKVCCGIPCSKIKLFWLQVINYNCMSHTCNYITVNNLQHHVTGYQDAPHYLHDYYSLL
jgi:hypothetical protein